MRVCGTPYSHILLSTLIPGAGFRCGSFPGTKEHRAVSTFAIHTTQCTPCNCTQNFHLCTDDCSSTRAWPNFTFRNIKFSNSVSKPSGTLHDLPVTNPRWPCHRPFLAQTQLIGTSRLAVLYHQYQHSLPPAQSLQHGLVHCFPAIARSANSVLKNIKPDTPSTILKASKLQPASRAQYLFKCSRTKSCLKLPFNSCTL